MRAPLSFARCCTCSKFSPLSLSPAAADCSGADDVIAGKTIRREGERRKRRKEGGREGCSVATRQPSPGLEGLTLRRGRGVDSTAEAGGW